MIIVDGEPYCPNYMCGDCGKSVCKRRADLADLKKKYSLFTRVAVSFPCNEFVPSSIHVFDLKNYWVDFESWYTDWLQEWQNGMSREEFENKSISFYINEEESECYHARVGDWIYGTLIDGDTFKVYERMYYREVDTPWGFELASEPINGVKIQMVEDK